MAGHIAFLRHGGADLAGEGALVEGWPTPEDIPGVWRLVTIDGVGPKTVDALIDAFEDARRRRAIGDIARCASGEVDEPPQATLKLEPKDERRSVVRPVTVVVPQPRMPRPRARPERGLALRPPTPRRPVVEPVPGRRWSAWWLLVLLAAGVVAANWWWLG